MNNTINVLHLTAHLGGGIGKAISGLILHTPSESGINHTIACLTRPEKEQFLRQLTDLGFNVVVISDHVALAKMIEASDIIQLEWWGHPATIATLCQSPLPAMRLLVWYHISGLYTPVIPTGLLKVAHRSLFTTPCSFESPEVAQLSETHRNRMDVVYSAGGFNGFTLPERRLDTPLVAGYLGSLNFAKLHPRYVEFVTAVPVPNFTVRMIGDITNRDILEEQCYKAGQPGILEFRGYTTDVASELAEINVLPYLLNPKHYGTTENALLEAMAMGVVPVVLNNPVERQLITDKETGLIVGSPQEFSEAILWLTDHPQERQKIGERASSAVRARFSVTKTVEAFNHHYASLCSTDKEFFAFDEIFGKTPAEWFLSNQRCPEIFSTNIQVSLIDEFTLPGLLERTKGSVFHYHRDFPDDMRLSRWTEQMETLV